MSETGHGSNVQAVETTATYRPETDELVINTPTQSARKDYIGNAAAHGQLAVVFAQLEVSREAARRARDRGADPHPRRRGVPGVTITDCGPKLGLKGVDNGRLEFDDVRVPRTNLLNRYADITRRR